MKRSELNEILRKHNLWLNDEEDGERADLCDANLNGINLSGVNLRYANLKNAYLKGADLHCTNLSSVNLSHSDLSNANLIGANLSDTNLSWAILNHANLNHANLKYAKLSDTDLGGTDLEHANLYHADLYHANLRGADLCGANLCNADLNRAELRDIDYDESTAFFAMTCPEEGAFIGYKKANGYIVKLEICADAKRSSAASRKCRCSAAKVLSITNLDGTESGLSEVASQFDKSFIYRVGEIVSVPNFCEDRWQECAAGIHFFITRDEAARY